MPRPAIVAFALAMLIITARAEDGNAEREALRRLQQHNRSLAQEKARLAEENAALERDRQRLEKQSRGAAARVASLGRELKRAEVLAAARQADLESATKEKDALAARLKELEQRLNQLESRLKAAEAERDSARAQLAESRQVIGRQAQTLLERADSRRKLEALADELLERYHEAASSEGNFFTGLSRVEVDNRASEYRDRIEALRLDDTRRQR
jgi:chromosome segregation ATPase